VDGAHVPRERPRKRARRRKSLDDVVERASGAVCRQTDGTMAAASALHAAGAEAVAEAQTLAEAAAVSGWSAVNK
jgi:hypothetical protein